MDEKRVMKQHTALVLDSDPETSATIIEQLRADGLDAIHCTSAAGLRDQMIRREVDICLIGARLPDGDGLSLVRELHNDFASGLIVLGDSTDELDAVLALEMGADDYVPKPVRLREIGARARSVMRRTLNQRRESDRDQRFLPDHYLRRLGELEICGIARSVTRNGVPVDLTTLEFDVLMVLAAQTNTVLSRARIISSVHGADRVVNDRNVDGIISRLRRKLFDGNEGAQRIKTVHGRGYLLIDTDAPDPVAVAG